MSTTVVPVPPVLEGPVRDEGQLQLRALTPEDYPWLYSWETTSWMARRWRMHGNTPHPEDWVNLIKQVPYQFIVQRQADDGPVRRGILYAHSESVRDGTIYVAGSRFHEEQEDAWPTDMTRGAALFINYLFVSFGFRKVYLEVPGYNEGDFTEAGVAAGYMVEEGRLLEHLLLDGRYWDLTTYAVWRDTWMGEPIQGMLRAGLRGEL